METNPIGATRRDVLKGVAAGAAGIMLGSMTTRSAQASFQPAMPSAFLPRATPTDAGVASTGIAAFVDAVNAKVGGLHSMILVRGGKVIAEASWAPYSAARTHMLYSLSKSFTSTAVGLAVSEKRLTVEDKVISFFADKLPATVSDNLAAMRVKDLLTMNSGHEKEPQVNDGKSGPDWVKTFLAAPVDHKPGTHFLYNTAGTHVLSAIVQKVTGQTLTAYLTPRLFEPLAIESHEWEQSPMGIDIGGYGLAITIESIAKFGQLYLQKGTWNGKQLIPAEWVAEATRKEVPNGDPATGGDWNQGYGYQFWRCRHDNYRGDGAFGQYCIVMPNHDAVLAITSGVGDMGAVLEAAWTHLLPAMQGPDNGDAALKTKLADQWVPPPEGKPTSPRSAQLSGKTWKFEPNDEKLKSIKITFDGDRSTILVVDDQGEHALPCGTGSWVEATAPFGTTVRPIASRMAWTSDDSFTLKGCFVDTPYILFETFTFAADGNLTIEKRHMNVAFGPSERPALKATLQA